MQEYPVVKMKELRNYKVGDVVRLKKTGILVEITKYGTCVRCMFYDQCSYGIELDYKTGCYGIGEDFGGEPVYFKPVGE